RGVHHYGRNPPLLKYRPELTQPARSTAERSPAATGRTRASRAEPQQANSEETAS
ncbi:hypothetical protein P7K49_015054, partial [Saguinus oedipus]